MSLPSQTQYLVCLQTVSSEVNTELCDEGIDNMHFLLHNNCTYSIRTEKKRELTVNECIFLVYEENSKGHKLGNTKTTISEGLYSMVFY